MKAGTQDASRPSPATAGADGADAPARAPRRAWRLKACSASIGHHPQGARSESRIASGRPLVMPPKLELREPAAPGAARPPIRSGRTTPTSRAKRRKEADARAPVTQSEIRRMSENNPTLSGDELRAGRAGRRRNAGRAVRRGDRATGSGSTPTNCAPQGRRRRERQSRRRAVRRAPAIRRRNCAVRRAAVRPKASSRTCSHGRSRAPRSLPELRAVQAR